MTSKSSWIKGKGVCVSQSSARASAFVCNKVLTKVGQFLSSVTLLFSLPIECCRHRRHDLLGDYDITSF